MIVKLAYGSDTVAVDLRGLQMRPLEPEAPRGAADPGRLLSRAVDFPFSGPALDELARDRRSAVVVVPDATRCARLPEVLPVIFTRLIAAGVPTAAMEVLVACGTHPPATAPEVETLLGELPDRVAVRQHTARDPERLVNVGELRPGLPLRLDRGAVGCDLLITVGTVRHHYFAGFGGGPKMVFPGIAGMEEIQANHALVLQRHDGRFVRHPGCEPGRLEGNPVAEEIARGVELHPPDFAVCLVLGRDGGIAWAGAGSWQDAFAGAVGRAREWYEIAPEGLDRIVVGGGGRPGDASLIQAHKVLDAACRFANPGAEILFAAELGDGAGAESMIPFLADPSVEGICRRLAEDYVQYGHTTLRIVEKTGRYRVLLHSSLDDELADRLGFHPVASLDEVAARWRDERGGRVGVMAGPPVWPRCGAPATGASDPS